MAASTIPAQAGKGAGSGPRPARAPCSTTKAGPRRGPRSTRCRFARIRSRDDKNGYGLKTVPYRNAGRITVTDQNEDFASMFEASLKAKRIEKGQTIEGTIVAINA